MVKAKATFVTTQLTADVGLLTKYFFFNTNADVQLILTSTKVYNTTKI
jgi:hypothetical protein